ncbi:hypothetical protein ACHWQZ_G010244 [Mnemiopsis leidyi]
MEDEESGRRLEGRWEKRSGERKERWSEKRESFSLTVPEGEMLVFRLTCCGGTFRNTQASHHDRADLWKRENFEDQKARKLKRYEQLLVEIETAGWKGDLFTVEVGCRGFYHDTLPRIFNFLNIPRAKKKRALNDSAVVALKGSYTIWLSRYNKTWSDNWQLAKRPGTV